MLLLISETHSVIRRAVCQPDFNLTRCCCRSTCTDYKASDAAGLPQLYAGHVRGLCHVGASVARVLLSLAALAAVRPAVLWCVALCRRRRGGEGEEVEEAGGGAGDGLVVAALAIVAVAVVVVVEVAEAEMGWRWCRLVAVLPTI